MRDRKAFYPTVSLPVALEKLQVLFDSHAQSEFTPQEAFASWGYKSNSRAGQKLLKTLESFSLVENISLEGHNLFKVSADSLGSVFDSKISANRLNDAFRMFSRTPDVYRLLWEKWKFDLPAEQEVCDFLMDCFGFNDRDVKNLVPDYMASLEFIENKSVVETSGGFPEDTNLEFDDEDEQDDEDVVELIESKQPQHLVIKEDTDLELDRTGDSPNKTRGLTLIRDGNDIDMDCQEDVIDTSDIDIDFSKTLLESCKEEKRPEEQGEPKLELFSEVGSFSVSSDCKFFLMADGPVDRGAFEALVAQLMLKLEIGEFDDEERS